MMSGTSPPLAVKPGKAFERQYALFKGDGGMIRSVVSYARHSQHARLGGAQGQLRPLNEVRGLGGLGDRYNMRHEHPNG
jgi:hypothetical protein